MSLILAINYVCKVVYCTGESKSPFETIDKLRLYALTYKNFKTAYKKCLNIWKLILSIIVRQPSPLKETSCGLGYFLEYGVQPQTLTKHDSSLRCEER